MSDSSLWFIAAAYAAATFAAVVAAVALSRRRVDGPSRPAAVAIVLFWSVGSVLTALQSMEAVLLLFGGAGLRLMMVLAFTTAALVAIAVTSLVYYAYFLARGVRPPIVLLALVGGALYVGGVWNAAGLLPNEVAGERLLSSMAARSPVSLGVWGSSATPLLCVVPIVLATRHVQGPIAHRARLVAGGLTAAVAGPVMAPWLDPGLRPHLEAVGIALAAIAIVAAYATRRDELRPISA